MPEFDRYAYEDDLSSALGPIFDNARETATAGRRVDYDGFARSVYKEIEDNLLAVYIVIYILMADDDSAIGLASLQGRAWARLRAREVTAGLAHNTAKEIQAGRDPEKVFSASRRSVLSATEVTRAISQGQTDARASSASRSSDPEVRARSSARGGAGGVSQDVRGARVPSPMSPLDVGDGLVPVWITARDDRVCPICGPLDSQRYEHWRDSFPSGPPAHPNCRCGLRYDPE